MFQPHCFGYVHLTFTRFGSYCVGAKATDGTEPVTYEAGFRMIVLSPYNCFAALTPSERHLILRVCYN